MPGIEGENPTPEQMQSMRDAVRDHIKENGKDVFNDSDVQRFNTDDIYVQRYFKTCIRNHRGSTRVCYANGD